MLGYVGPILGPAWVFVGPTLALCWAILGLCWPMLAEVAPMLGLCWPLLGLGLPMLALCWASLEAMLCRHRFVQEDQEDENSCLCEGLAGHVGPVLVAEQAHRMRFTNMMPEALK